MPSIGTKHTVKEGTPHCQKAPKAPGRCSPAFHILLVTTHPIEGILSD